MTIVKLFLWPRGRIGRLSFWRALLGLLVTAFAADLLAAKLLEDAGRSRFLAAIPAAVLIVGLASVGFLVGALDGRAPAPWTMLGFFGPLTGIVVFLGATLWIGLAKTRV